MNLKNAIDTAGSSEARGVKIFNSNGLIELFDVNISGNTADYGAGMYIKSSSSGTLNVILNNTFIYGNVSSGYGGGIQCSRASTSITLKNNSGIFENQAYRGGGVGAIDGCKVTVSSGEDARLSNTISGVVRNFATNDGGGIYADNSAKIYFQGNRYGSFGILGNSYLPATLADNQAIGNGGGIAASQNSLVELYDTLVWNNKSSNYGGGLHLDDSSTLLMTTSDQPNCWNQKQCSILASNSADRGGAIYQARGSTAKIDGTHIFKNKANLGLVLYSREDGVTGTDSKFHNNMIYRNGQNATINTDGYLFRGYEPVTVELTHNTITENDINDNYAIIGAASGAEFTVQNSIIHNTGETVYTGTTADLFASCVLVNESTSLVGGNIRNQAPSFVNPASDNFHIALGSEAVDMCTPINGFTHDIDGELRGFDDPISDIQGPYDAGADESYASDIIFKHGFE